jgi:hypothetical protein
MMSEILGMAGQSERTGSSPSHNVQAPNDRRVSSRTSWGLIQVKADAELCSYSAFWAVPLRGKRGIKVVQVGTGSRLHADLVSSYKREREGEPNVHTNR